MSTTIDITAVTRLKHADIYEAAKRLGGQAALARHLGISQGDISSWCNLQRVPRKLMRDAERRKDVEQKLYELTGKTLDEIFPEALANASAFLKAKKQSEKTIAIEAAALLAFRERTVERLTVNPLNNAQSHELTTDLSKVLTTLTERENLALRLRFGIDDGVEHTFDQVGEQLKVCGERAKQIVDKAINKLRQPTRSAKLVGHSP